MRFLAAIPLTLLSAASMAVPVPDRQADLADIADAVETPAPHSLDPMNAFSQPKGCPSIMRQVAGEDRRYDGTRLDQQPPGRLLMAVDRQVENCHQATFANEERFGPSR